MECERMNKKEELKKGQIGFFAQEISKVYELIKDRELTEKEKDFFQELGFALVLDYREHTNKRTIDLFNELNQERKQDKIKQLKESLKELED